MRPAPWLIVALVLAGCLGDVEPPERPLLRVVGEPTLVLEGNEVKELSVTLANDGAVTARFADARLLVGGVDRERWASLTALAPGSNATQTLSTALDPDAPPPPTGDFTVEARFTFENAPPLNASVLVRHRFSLLGVEPGPWDAHGLTGVNVTVLSTGDVPTHLGRVEWGLRHARDEPFFQELPPLDPDAAPRTFFVARGEFAGVYPGPGASEVLDVTVYDAWDRVIGLATKSLPGAGARLLDVTPEFTGCPQRCELRSVAFNVQSLTATPVYVHTYDVRLGDSVTNVSHPFGDAVMVEGLLSLEVGVWDMVRVGPGTLSVRLLGVGDTPLAAASVQVTPENGRRTYMV